MDTPLHGMDLPNEIIEKIFLGCHVKLLTTFKCLSKDWNVIISEDSFRKRYWSQQQSDGNSPTGFICGFMCCPINNLYKYGFYMANKFLCTSKNYVKKKELDSFAYTNMSCRYIIAASKGLLLLTDDLKTLCVYDLVSKKHFTLPRNNLETRYRLSLGFKCEERGTNHHPHLCYKVVLVDNRGDCDIYSSETGIWQKTILKTRFPFRRNSFVAKVIRGVFHWYFPFGDTIIAYDSEDPKGRAVFIEVPSMGHYYRENMALFEGTKDGSLQFICIDENNQIKVWIILSTSGQNYMDDDDIVRVSKWILTSSVSLFDIGVSFGDIDFFMKIHARAISVDPIDPHIFYLVVACKLYAYDYRQGRVVFTYSEGLPAGANVFVPFEWPTWPCL